MSWQEKVKNRLPNLVVGEYWWVHGNIFIDDLGLSGLGLAQDIPKLKVSCQVLSPADLNVILRKILPLDEFSFFIFPGRGAQYLKKMWGLSGIMVQARRTGFDPPRVEVEGFVTPENKKILVLDDVISSGLTALEVMRKGHLQNAALAAWIMQSPHNPSLCCYQVIFVGYLVRSEAGKVPVNSLSTFLERPEVLGRYAQKYAQNPAEFQEFFTWLFKEGLGCNV